ncbi:MAG: hydroxyacid dehydrogenase [candidate division Zixibacteria bacterium]|nr:hydroxyacid dehydrogenase [candidate division Zixibacteria bacterium]
MKILLADAFDASLPETLRKYGEVTADAAQLPEADIVLIRSKTKATKEYIDQAAKMKLIIRGGVGLDNVDVPYCKEKGIVVKNTPEASSIAVAELAFAMMIAVPNRLIEAHNSMKEGKWLKKELKRTELYGKTLGLIGCGRIGVEVAKRAVAFGMKVVGYDPVVTKSDYIEPKPSLDAMLPLCDYISLHTPVNDQTKGMINKNTIAKMKKGVVFVNTGRGKCIIEQDVVDALMSGQMAAYATDVWYSDPPAEDCPLSKAPNMLMAPHIGASSNENLLRIGKQVDQIIGAFVAGK